MDIENPNPASPGATPPPIPSMPPPPATPPPRIPSAVPIAGGARRERGGRGWKVAVLILSLLLGVSLLSNVTQSLFGGMSAAGGSDIHLLETVLENNHAEAKIAVVPVEGVISGTSQDGYDLVERIK